jgi:hypothetical protein
MVGEQTYLLAQERLADLRRAADQKRLVREAAQTVLAGSASGDAHRGGIPRLGALRKLCAPHNERALVRLGGSHGLGRQPSVPNCESRIGPSTLREDYRGPDTHASRRFIGERGARLGCQAVVLCRHLVLAAAEAAWRLWADERGEITRRQRAP